MAITGQAGMTYWAIFSVIHSRVVFIGLAAEKALSRWPSFSVALWPITRPAQRVAYSIQWAIQGSNLRPHGCQPCALTKLS